MTPDRLTSMDVAAMDEAVPLSSKADSDILILMSGEEGAGGTMASRAHLAACAAVRLVADVPLAQIADRLELQSRLDVIWLKGRSVIDAAVSARILVEADRLGAAIICEMDGAALDAAFAHFADRPGVQFLVDPDPVDCDMAIAAARAGRSLCVADGGASVALQRIDQLQEEVARISALLSALAEREEAYLPRGGPVSFSPMVRAAERSYRPEPDFAAFGHVPPPSPTSAMVRRILRQRRMREQFFPAEMFADPAWDMLLDLYAAQLEGHPVAVSSLCIAAAVPATTALRWIKTMTDGGLFERQADPRDGRRIFIGLAPSAATAMERYFSAVVAMRD